MVEQVGGQKMQSCIEGDTMICMEVVAEGGESTLDGSHKVE